MLEWIADLSSVDVANWVVVGTCVPHARADRTSSAPHTLVTSHAASHLGRCVFSTALLALYAFVERKYASYLVGTQKRALEHYPMLCCFFAAVPVTPGSKTAVVPLCFSAVAFFVALLLTVSCLSSRTGRKQGEPR